jgi:hypothetical protein
MANQRGHVLLESINPGLVEIGAEVAVNSPNSLVDKVNRRTIISPSTVATT